ncbi:MAG: YegS/Rv2252/BmrU family lipid kinase [Firmicutes bacterium]|nr:YegS/Rv2252/BmrU family lipid kinase [Bacillota bacterium]
MKKLLLIINLHSGKAVIGEYIAEMLDFYSKKDYDISVYCSQGRGYIEKRIADVGSEYNNIIVCGGDGSFNEAVNGVMKLKTKPVLGYVPCGSTNDFANTIGIPTDIYDAYVTALEGNSFKIDVGKFENKYFSYVAGFGLFTNLSYDTDQNIKNLLGYQAYVLKGISELSAIKNYNMRVEYDEGVIEDNFIVGLVTNSNRIAGIDMNLSADYSDGLFEVLLIKTPNILTVMPTIVNALIDHNFNNDYMYYFKTSSVKFSSTNKVFWTIDGESGGGHKDVNISVKKRAIVIKI